ncbi:MAG TPA: AbrB/MazE/SpoVT family DNA-binding domain-containing protein [Thermoanaerobaculia bacterium]|nr:AbrB/MazE/SpoVT family DNA-binding domain-containing protein [Thermoanaerobaculia bacterium]
METTLDELGRILLPKEIRDDLGLEPGAVLRIEERDAGIYLTPEASETGDPYLIRKGGVLVFTGQAEADLESAVQRMRDERDEKVAGMKLK